MVCSVCGACIEKREKIKPELVSFQNEFQVNQVSFDKLNQYSGTLLTQTLLA